MNKRLLIVSVVITTLLLEAGCITSDDPNKREKRALMGGTTSTALGIATGVGGPILAARAAMGATSRVITGDTVDKIKEKRNKEDEKPIESGAAAPGSTSQ